MLNKCITKNNYFETDLYDKKTINSYPTFAVCQTKCKTFHILNNFVWYQISCLSLPLSSLISYMLIHNLHPLLINSPFNVSPLHPSRYTGPPLAKCQVPKYKTYLIVIALKFLIPFYQTLSRYFGNCCLICKHAIAIYFCIL